MLVFNLTINIQQSIDPNFVQTQTLKRSPYCERSSC